MKRSYNIQPNEIFDPGNVPACFGIYNGQCTFFTRFVRFIFVDELYSANPARSSTVCMPRDT